MFRIAWCPDFTLAIRRAASSFQWYPFPPIGPSLVKWVSRRQQGHTTGIYLPTAVARSTQPLKRCPARAKLQEMTSYVLSCSCAKRDSAASTFRKVQRQGPWRSSSTAVRRTWEAGTLLDCPPPAPSTYSPRVCSWVDRIHGAPWLHAEDLSQAFLGMTLLDTFYRWQTKGWLMCQPSDMPGSFSIPSQSRDVLIARSGPDATRAFGPWDTESICASGPLG